MFLKRKKDRLTENLETILTNLEDIELGENKNGVKLFHSKHNMLIATTIELSGALPLKQRLLVRRIVDKCRYD